MTTNERMHSIKQTATMQGDKHMTTTEQTAQTQQSKRSISAKERRAEIVIAALFLVTAAVSIPGAFVLDAMLNTPNYLAQVFPNKGVVALGSLLWSINNIGIVFIAVFA